VQLCMQVCMCVGTVTARNDIVSLICLSVTKYISVLNALNGLKE